MKIKLILKGVLLYVTTFVTILFLCGIDSIVEQGYLIPWVLTITLLIYICYKYISFREFYILSLNRWFNKITKTHVKK